MNKDKKVEELALFKENENALNLHHVVRTQTELRINEGAGGRP